MNQTTQFWILKKKTDDKHEIDVSVDIQNAILHMKRVKKPYITLATKDGEIVKKSEEIDLKIKDDQRLKQLINSLTSSLVVFLPVLILKDPSILLSGNFIADST